MNYHPFKDSTILYQFEVTMEQDELNTAEAVVEVIGITHNHAVVERTANKYHIERKGKREKWLADPIDYPAILLPFQDPVDIEISFAAETGIFHANCSMGNHSYKKSTQKEERIGIIEFEIILRD
ncbi:MAG: hypothetical protein IPL46_02535 [Saprospiraceae bacterium]|nr:hypothetical protein [Saprospiraceae bacterium]